MISDGNRGSVASPRMRRMYSSSAGTGSRATTQLPALLARAVKLWLLRHCHVKTLLTDEPASRSMNHRPKVVPQDAIGTADDLVAHLSSTFYPTGTPESHLIRAKMMMSVQVAPTISKTMNPNRVQSSGVGSFQFIFDLALPSALSALGFLFLSLSASSQYVRGLSRAFGLACLFHFHLERGNVVLDLDASRQRRALFDCNARCLDVAQQNCRSFQANAFDARQISLHSTVNHDGESFHVAADTPFGLDRKAAVE